MILKRMKRRHLREDAIAMCARARRHTGPDMAFGADIIAGFPTETDAMFENSMRIVDECDLTFLHVFPYSERDGHAGRQNAAGGPKPVRKERAARLREKGDEQVQKFLKFHVKQQRQVIVEKDNFGRTEHFAQVMLDGSYSPGSLLRVTTTGIEKDYLTGV
jgi:threonylcarbamoyladenosine tRNA methylthiotransferase MtaB